jgi:hypothetical protein
VVLKPSQNACGPLSETAATAGAAAVTVKVSDPITHPKTSVAVAQYNPGVLTCTEDVTAPVLHKRDE